MLKFTVRRLAGTFPVILIGLTLVFFAIHLAPGDPMLRFMDPAFPPAVRAQIISNFGLDRPLLVQYLSWLKSVLFHFEWGYSFQSGQSVAKIIAKALPASILVGGLALLTSLVLGISGGILAAVSRGTWIDRTINAILLVFYSLPAFLLALLLIGLLAVKLGWFPTSQITAFYHDQLNTWERIADVARHIFLPVLTLGLIQAATFARYLRSSLLESLGSDYVLAARARGITEMRVVLRHALPNALSAVISLIGVSIPVLFNGMVLIEVIYSLPGMGRITVDAVFARDYPVIMATATVAFVAVTVSNLLADLGYALIDPRVRLAK